MTNVPTKPTTILLFINPVFTCYCARVVSLMKFRFVEKPWVTTLKTSYFGLSGIHRNICDFSCYVTKYKKEECDLKDKFVNFSMKP